MGPKAKILISAVLIVIVGLAVWQFTSPPSIPVVGTKYLLTPEPSHQGSWVEFEKTGSGSLFLGFTITNTTFPRELTSTTYSIVISKVNQTIRSALVRNYSLKVTGLTILDNYDGTATGFDASSSLTDAVQVTTLFDFRTPNGLSALHQLRFTINYDVYNLYFFGYTIDHSQTRSYNITQNVI